jgi:AcrR family transcriptional regulator
MPKETFYNLSEGKREKIIEAAMKEFEQKNFDSSSINKIVENSGISKGSFYQYFADKKDLYKYIIQIGIEMKLKYLSPVMQNPKQHDIFTLIREMFKSALMFAAENPRLVNIGNHLLSNKSHPVYKEIMSDNITKSYDVFEGLILHAMKKGEIRKGLDPEFLGYIISNLSMLIVEYHHDNEHGIVDDTIIKSLDQLLDLLEYGIGTHKKEV